MQKEFIEIAEYGQVLREQSAYIEMLDKDSLKSNRNYIEQQTVGEKAHISFRCPNCGSEHLTKGRYKIGDNAIQQELRSFSIGNLWTSFLENTIGNIPWIGDTITYKAERKVGDKRSEKYSKWLDKVKINAFEKEMKSVFMIDKKNNAVFCKDCGNGSENDN
jgi:DNA-directed RNA polymerase subunit RPC12/RpoP